MTSSPPSTANVFASLNEPVALHPVDAVRLEERGDALGHLRDDARLPLVRLRRSRAAARRRDAELAERVARLVQEVRGLHPGLRRDAADAEAGAAELRLLLDADDLGAELRGADRGDVAAGAASEDGDVALHAYDASRVKLEGIHHVTCITGDAPRNVEFYAGTLGLRMVKKTVNQDDPTVYHLFYADERGSAGSDITFFEYPGARRGRPATGWCTGSSSGSRSEEALDFWAERRRRASARTGLARFADPEGLALELVVDDVGRRAARRAPSGDPGRARAARLRRRARVRVRAGAERAVPRARSASTPGTGRRAATERGGLLRLRRAAGRARARGRRARCTTSPGRRRPTSTRPGASASTAAAGGRRRSIDRFCFRSIYFREPSGVLFEIATLGPGFTDRRAARDARRAALAAARSSSRCASSSSAC